VSEVVFSPTARLDLLQIGDSIAPDSPRRALTFIEELRAKAKKIAFRPFAYPPRNDLRQGVRMAVHGRYLILFEVDGSDVRVLRIVHGARDLRGLLQEQVPVR
jgi:toxin ParE1/3/4